MHNERVQSRATRCSRKSIRGSYCDRFIVFAVVIFGMLLAVADATTTKTTFNIEAQPAKSSLTLFARQAQVQLGFAADVVDDIRTNPVEGEYDYARALDLLLEGTGLEAEHGASGIIIRRIPERVVTSGVEEPAPDLAKTNSLQLAQTSQAAWLAPEALVAGTEREEVEEPPRKLEEILVTGSRIRGAQNASPVVTITREEIDRAGFATVEEIFDKLPQNFGAGASLDTRTDTINNAGAVGGSVGSFAGGTSVNLRGLGASSTLILLNGRRISPSGRTARFSDISRIPVSAIERVEVLTDGASAIYGSDAIGGVVNFILREDYEGAETRLRYGSDTNGDTSDILFGQSLGKSWDNGSILLTYEYFQNDNLANSDRAFASSNDLTRFGGNDWRTLGGNPANIIAGGQTFAIPTGQDGTSLTAADFDSNAPLNFHNNRSVGDLLPEQERHSAFLQLTQAIGPVDLFAQVQYSSQDSVVRSNFNTVDITVPDTNPFFVDPTGTGLSTVQVDNYALDDDLGPHLEEAEIGSYGAVLGARFDIGDVWNVELAGNWSKEKAASERNITFDSIALADAVNQTERNLAFNPFGDGSHTNPAVLERLRAAAITSRELNYSENELRAVSLNVDGVVFNLPGGAAKVAAGSEFREESLLIKIRNGQNSTGLAVLNDLRRDVLAIYTELFFPLVSSSNSLPGLQRLELSLAGRYEDYSDFGNSANPKLGLLWSPTQALTLRGAYGTSFRAPALFDLDVTSLDSNVAQYIPDVFVPPLPFPLILRLGANEDLQAEEATTWTAGFQWAPERINGFALDITYFNVDFEERIETPGGSVITASTDPRFGTLLTTNPTPEQIAAIVNDPRWTETAFGVTTPAEDVLSGSLPIGGILDMRKNNLAQSVVTGVELQLSYNFETPLGSFDIGVNGNYLFDFKRKFIETDPLVNEIDTLGRPVDFRARGNVSWRHQAWAVSTFVNYTDGYTDNLSDPARPIDSWITADLTVSYDTWDVGTMGIFGNTRLSLTVQNLFDEGPPFVNTLGGLAYDSANGNPLGRFLAFQVTKNW